MLEVLPREFDMKIAMQHTGWDKGKVRQAIIAGAIPPRVIPITAFQLPSLGPLPSSRHANARLSRCS